MTTVQPKKRVAVVGSGCAGLGAFWALKSTTHEVHLFEIKDRIGGHTNTVSFQHDGRTTNVDTGFIVMNAATYRKQPMESFIFDTDRLQPTSYAS